jgi:molybdenum cofactor synthesis domain-containing protein
MNQSNRPRIELLPIGRELLTGRIRESNAQWMAERITRIGGNAARITVLDDNVFDIAREVRAASKRGTDFLIACGGLGPTFDDITLKALAEGAGIAIELDEQAQAFIAGKYREYFAKGQVPHSEMTPEREKMARLPVGGRIIENEVGVAPGVVFHIGGMAIVALPGPPREMQPMYLSAVESLIADALENRSFKEVTLATDGTDESVLTSACREISESFSGLHAKTNPTFFGDENGLTITLSVWAESDEQCRVMIGDAIESLEMKLVGLSITLTQI